MTTVVAAIEKFLSSDSPAPSKFRCKTCGHEGNTETDARHVCKDKTHKMAERQESPSAPKPEEKKPSGFDASLKTMADLLREPETLTEKKLPAKPQPDPKTYAPDELNPGGKDLDKRAVEGPLMNPKNKTLPPMLPEEKKAPSSVTSRIKSFL